MKNRALEHPVVVASRPNFEIPAFAFLLSAALLLVAVAPANGSLDGTRSVAPSPPVPTNQEQPVRRVVVRYAPDIAVAVDRALAARGRLAGTEGVPPQAASALDSLHREVGVRAARPIISFGATEGGADPVAVYRSRAGRLRRGLLARHSPAGSRRPASSADLAGTLSRIYVLELEPGADARAAAARLSASPWVDYAQPDWRVQKLAAPSDPLAVSSGSFGQPYPDLWGLYAVKAPEAWTWTRGRQPDGTPVVVAVVDTGVDLEHEDLRSRIWANPSEVPGNGIDDDGNGYIDDVVGWDFTTCRRFSRSGRCLAKDPDNDPTDRDGHGTHVAATIAAEADNGLGIAGVAPEARILPVKALDDRGTGLVSWLAAGIVYAAANGARVINNSWGCSYCPQNPVIEDAVRFAHEAGAVVVFAAGNSASDVALASPQNMSDPKPVVVAACTPEMERTRFSSFGREVDLCAPGGGSGSDLYNIVSARARRCAGRSCPRELRVGKQYIRFAGTSMAAPHVAGAAALLLARFPELSPDQVRRILRATARDAGSPGLDIYTGAGMVDAAAALETAEALTAARIDEPGDGASFEPASGSIAVRATISGTALSSYEILLGAGAAPENWTVVGSGTDPVAGQVVARIDPDQLSTGLYVLRLAAHTEGGRTFQDLVRFAFEIPPDMIAPGPNAQTSPSVDGPYVAWTETDPATGSARVRVADLDSGAIRDINGAGGFAAGPTVAGSWVDFLTFQGDSWDVCSFDLRADRLTLVTSDDLDQFSPHGDASILAYLACRNHGYRSCIQRGRRDVYLYDRTTGTRTALTSDGRSRGEVVASGPYVAWTQFRRGVGTVWLLDRRTGIAIPLESESGGSQSSPVLDARHLVWEEYDTAAGVWRIRARDLDSGYTWWVTGPEAHAIAPSLSDGRAAWMSSENGNWDIVAGDIERGDRQLVTANPAPQIDPDISCTNGTCRVVWADRRSAGAHSSSVWNIASTVLP